jgi:hypothetical protein
MHASHVIDPREAHLDELEDGTWTPHGLKDPRGPKPNSFLTFTEKTPMGPHTSHLAKREGQLGP